MMEITFKKLHASMKLNWNTSLALQTILSKKSRRLLDWYIQILHEIQYINIMKQ